MFLHSDRTMRGDTQNVLSTNGPYWEALRKVALVAVRLDLLKLEILGQLNQKINFNV